MAGNEEILLQFRADDQVTSTVRSMGTNVLNTIGSIQTAMSQLNNGLGNFAGSANLTGQAFGNGEFQQAPLLLSETSTAAEGAKESFDDLKEGADNASKSNQDLADSAKSVANNSKESSSNTKDLSGNTNELVNETKDAGKSVDDLSGALQKNTSEGRGNTSATDDNKTAKQGLGNETKNTKNDTEELTESFKNNTNLTTLSAGSAMYLAGQLSSLGTRMEDSAHRLNELSISVGQVAKMSGMAEDDMTNMITSISNETFPNDEAIMYTKNLVQMGVDSKNFAEQATNIDRINDAFGLGAETSNSLAMELSVLGVDANHLESSFNALAYANENTKGGMQNYFSFLRKYDSELSQLGYDVDQTSIIISAATQKYGGGRAALSGLSEALKDAGSDTSALEQALDLKAGALDHAAQETGTYEGQLQSLANEEMEHKTWLDRINAAWDDFTLKNSAIITLGQSVMGVFGQTGQIGLTVIALKEIGLALSNWSGASAVLTGAISRMKALRSETQMAGKVVGEFTRVNPAAMTPIDPATVPNAKAPTTVPVNTKGTKQVAKGTQEVVKDAGMIASTAPEATAAAGGVAETGGALSAISASITSLLIPLLSIAAVIAIMLPVIAGLAIEAIALVKGIQLVIKAMDFDSVDLSSAIEGIKQVGEAIWEVARAMGAMALANVMTIVTVFTGGIMGLINPLGLATHYLTEASKELQKFADVQIPNNVPSNIKKIADSIEAVTKAFDALIGLNLNMIKGNILTLGGLLGNVKDAIRTAREEIIYAGQEIAKIKNVPDIDESVVGKLEKIGSSLESIGKAYESLGKIRDQYNWDTGWLSGWFQDFNIQESLVGIKDTIFEAARTLSIYKDLPDVDENVGNKLEKVGSALESISKAIESLKNIKDQYNWDNGWLGGLFQDFDVIGALRGVKSDIWNVAGELRSMKDMPAIPDGVGEKLKKTSSSLKSVLSSIKSMKKIQEQSDNKKSGDFSNVITTIKNARVAIYQASAHMRALSGISAIKEGTEDKIKKVTGVIKDVVSAISEMNKINGVSLNPTNLVKTFRDARTTIGTISEGLRSYRNIANVPEGVADKVKSVKNTAKQVVGVINTLNDIKTTDLQPTQLVSTFHNARSIIGTISEGLRSYRNIANVPESVPTKVKAVSKSATKVVDAIKSLNSIKNVSFSAGNLVTTFSNARKSIGTISVGLASYRNIANIPDNVAGKLKKINTTSRAVTTAIEGIKTVPQVNPEADNIKNAVSRTKKTITQLNKLKGKKVGNVSSVLSKVKEAVSNLKKSLQESNNFTGTGVTIGSDLSKGINNGLKGLSGIVSSNVTSAMRTGGSNAWTGGAVMAISALGGFKSAFLLSSVISTEMNNGLIAITSATPDLTNAMGQLANQMVNEFKSNAGIASPGDISRSIRDEMGYMKGFVVNNGKSVISSIGNLATGMVNTFNPNLQSSLDLNTGRLDSMRNMSNNGNTPNNTNTRGTVIIQFNEGAIQLDARNMTTQESRQIILNAIEGLEVVEGINIKGV